MIVLLLALGLWGGADLQSRKPHKRVVLRPIDQALSEPTLLAFRTAVEDALEQRNTEKILEFMTEPLSQHWRPLLAHKGFAEEPAFWQEFLEVVRLGGTFLEFAPDRRPGIRRIFCAPYLWGAFPPLADLPVQLRGENLPYAIIGAQVAVRELPDLRSPVIRRLSYDLVQKAENAIAKPGWVAVTTQNGEQGYVSERWIRSRGDYRACFGETEAGWRITVFSDDGGG